jgi:glycosyltransferase involved in cell wall biosynthesis
MTFREQGENHAGISQNSCVRAVFIISTAEVLGGKTAGARRILNIAKSIAAGRVEVYICSLADYQNYGSRTREISNGIFAFVKGNTREKNKNSFQHYLRQVNSLMAQRTSEHVVYLYPTTLIWRDFAYLIYFKFLKGCRFFCEINELRSSIAFSSPPPKNLLHKPFYYFKSIKDFVIFKLNELQVCLYDGIIVISTSLERYFSRLAKRMIRIPILCDSSMINKKELSVVFNEEIFKICFAGYIKFEKEGFDIFLEALSFVNSKYPVELYLYGILSNEDNLLLTGYINKFNLTNHVFYKGNIDPEQLQYEFNKYHLLVLPRPLNKRTKYGFSTKLSEYLVSGKPVLLTDVSDNAMFIKDSSNGFLISPGNTNTMAGKLIEIIDNYNLLAEDIVKNAFITVKEKLDYKLYTQDYIEYFFPGTSEIRDNPDNIRS